MSNYQELEDQELFELLESGDESVVDCLMDKYKYLVRKQANALYLIGAEKEDLIQEGMIGLFRAIRDFRKEKEVTFYHFAEICIQRQMYHAIEASQRKKHAPLNSYVSLSPEKDEESDVYLKAGFDAEPSQNPEIMWIEREHYEQLLQELLQRLSKMEKEVLRYSFSGMDYKEIASKLGKEPKAIDNALQRIRKKALLVDESCK